MTLDTRTTISPISVDVCVYPDVAVQMRDFGTGAYVRIGLGIGDGDERGERGHVDLTLGYDPDTRRDACDRLIAALTAAREWEPVPEPVA